MIIINKTKHIKEYQIPEMPNFQHRKSKVAWLKRQKMLAAISNIKSISVQIKDIKYMIYSNNPRLISLYTKFYLSNSSNSYDDNDYIIIHNSTDLNKSLIYAIISTDWLLNFDDIEKKSVEEIRKECLDLQNKIYELNERKKQMINHENIDFKIKLYEYKLSCLKKLELNKVETQRNSNQTTILRVLLKDKK